VRLWSLPAGTERAVLPVGYDVFSLAFSSDSKFLLISTNYDLQIWDAVKVQKLTQYKYASGGYKSAAAFVPPGQRLAAGWTKGYSPLDKSEVLVWDWQQAEKPAFRQEVPGGKIMSMAFAPDGETMAWGRDGEVILWDSLQTRSWNAPAVPVKDGKDRSLTGLDGLIKAVAFSPNGTRVAAGNAAAVAIWDVKTGIRQEEYRGHQSEVWGLAFSPDAKALASADLKGTVILRKLGKQGPPKTFQFPGAIQGAAFDANGQYLATANGNGSVYILRVP
jgi:WD40 repeat protein